MRTILARSLRGNARVAFMLDEEYRRLSYVMDWLDAFRASPRLDLELCDINDSIALAVGMRRLKSVPLAIVLHSAAGDDLSVLQRAVGAFQARTGRLLVFFGNEYVEMDHKIRFARESAADFIGSQLPIDAARWLYAECPTARVLPAPPALNPDVYRPGTGPRPIDIGFRGDLYDRAYALGDIERTAILSLFGERASSWGLRADIEFVRQPREEWARFLAICKGIVGAESGTYYLERDDHTRRAVIPYLDAHPDASFDEVHARFFRDYPDPVSGKAISSRHFEPLGTKTCQILVEGRYNDILRPGVHYISVRKDLSDVKEAVEAFKDEKVRREITENAYEYAISAHTYAHRVETLLEAVLA